MSKTASRDIQNLAARSRNSAGPMQTKKRKKDREREEIEEALDNSWKEDLELDIDKD